MIANGKDIGGAVSYAENSYARVAVAGTSTGEDYSVFNPGLSLLTLKEKEALTAALHQVKGTADPAVWKDKDISTNRVYLMRLLDPLKTYELRPYLTKLPFIAFAAYAASIAAQFLAKDSWPFIYVGLAVVALAPGLFIYVFS